jgi:hypothetical protein
MSPAYKKACRRVNRKMKKRGNIQGTSEAVKKILRDDL